MKKLAVLLLATAISGCATVGSYQQDCEVNNNSFDGMVQCLKKSAYSDSRMKNDSRIKYYLLNAEKLSQSVQSNEISEIDARIQLQEIYLSLKGQEMTEQQKNAQIYQMLKPKTTNTSCTSHSNSLNCNTIQY